MATTATQHPAYPTPVPTEGPFGAQGERPGVGLPRAGEFAKGIERETARWPSSTFLLAALGTLLLFGVYKLGSNR